MKTALITGASSGIGKELAFVYAKNGYNLILVARRKTNLELIKDEINNKHKISVTVIDMDLSSVDSAEILYNTVSEQKLSVDVLINNAGYGVQGLFKETDMKWEESMLILNMVTLTKLTKLFAKDMANKRDGNIINISSTAAFQPVPNLSTYAASKAYVLSFSEAIAYQLKDDNVVVTTICPGATKSEFADVAKMNQKHFIKAPSSQELAEYTYKSMKKGKTTAIHGFKNKVMVFLVRLTPRKIITAVASKFMD